MIKFRNPGLYKTQIEIFRELYKEYKNAPYFSLNDMKNTIAKTRLMTAYGYSGEAALSLSNTKNDSLNSTKMNQKMYAEVFRMLGWITSAGEKSYPLVFTYLGKHIAESEDPLSLYEQCVLGINNPQQIIDVDYDENVRFFKTVLRSFIDLGGIMYKHEFCLGPMSVNDTNEETYCAMISYIGSLRGSFENYKRSFARLCSNLKMTHDSVDNSTRLPIDCMRTCGWIEPIISSDIYPPKPLKCWKLTKRGFSIVSELLHYKDLRLNEFNTYPENIQNSLIRLGFYSMMKRAGYDISSVTEIINEDSIICADILNGKELLFSPYQTLKGAVVDKALGFEASDYEEIIRTETFSNTERPNAIIKNISSVCNGDLNIIEDYETSLFVDKVIELKNHSLSKECIIDSFFNDMRDKTESTFYPFVAMLFRIMGLKCHASRTGDNGARWDLMIEDDTESIPVEVKSPTEVLHLSLKAIRQALENKIILLSREEYPTLPETTSLAISYLLPTDRTECTNLINDFRITYGFNIGIIDFRTLLNMAITVIYDRKTFDLSELNRLEGFANVSSN